MGGKDIVFLVMFQNIEDVLRPFQHSSTDFWLFLGYAKTTKITRNQDLRGFAGVCGVFAGVLRGVLGAEFRILHPSFPPNHSHYKLTCNLSQNSRCNQPQVLLRISWRWHLSEAARSCGFQSCFKWRARLSQ